MKTKSVITAIALFLCCAEFHLAAANSQVQEEAQKKAEVVGMVPTQDKALAKPEVKSEEPEVAKPKKTWSFTFGGEITNYFVAESNAFFGESARNWLETSLRLDSTLRYKHFTAGASGLAIKTTGLDSYGTGTTPAGAPSGTSGPSSLPVFYLDKAYIQLDQIGGLPLKATLGRYR